MYYYGKHPFLRIGPVKAEEVYHSPDLVIFYDVINDREIDIVKQLANTSIYQISRGGRSPKYLHELSEKMSKYLHKLWFFRKNSTRTPPIVKNKSA